MFDEKKCFRLVEKQFEFELQKSVSFFSVDRPLNYREVGGVNHNFVHRFE